MNVKSLSTSYTYPCKDSLLPSFKLFRQILNWLLDHHWQNIKTNTIQADTFKAALKEVI